MMNEKYLVFDMDGTIADLYGVDNWLTDLRAYNPRPYKVAKPLYDVDVLNAILEILKAQGWKVIVTSWLAKDSDKAYDEAVTMAKIEWLKKYNFPADEINCVAYGVSKTSVTKAKGGFQILIDDNAEVRAEWGNGRTINATENILTALVDLI